MKSPPRCLLIIMLLTLPDWKTCRSSTFFSYMSVKDGMPGEREHPRTSMSKSGLECELFSAEPLRHRDLRV